MVNFRMSRQDSGSISSNSTFVQKLQFFLHNLFKQDSQDLKTGIQSVINFKKAEMDEFIDKHAESYKNGHIYNSQNQLLKELRQELPTDTRMISITLSALKVIFRWFGATTETYFYSFFDVVKVNWP